MAKTRLGENGKEHLYGLSDYFSYLACTPGAQTHTVCRFSGWCKCWCGSVCTRPQPQMRNQKSPTRNLCISLWFSLVNNLLLSLSVSLLHSHLLQSFLVPCVFSSTLLVFFCRFPNFHCFYSSFPAFTSISLPPWRLGTPQIHLFILCFNWTFTVKCKPLSPCAECWLE